MFNELTAAFNCGRTHLCIDVDQQRVILCRLEEVVVGPASIVMDLQAACGRFMVKTGGATEFRNWHIASIAGHSVPVITRWVRSGILVASISPPQGQGKDIVFSNEDAFVAGIVGTLRRFGVEGDMLKKAADYLRQLEFVCDPFDVSRN